MNKQDKAPMVSREVVKPSLENIRREVEKEDKREDEESIVLHKKH